MSGYTPGPWEAEAAPEGQFGKNWKRIRARGGRFVVIAGTFTRMRGGEQETYAGVVMSDADAKLMAAAPTMREELAGIAADLGVWAGMSEIPESVRRSLRARAAELTRVLATIPEAD